MLAHLGFRIWSTCQKAFGDSSQYRHTVRVVVENSDYTFLVACKDRQETIGEEEIRACQGSGIWVLPKDR